MSAERAELIDILQGELDRAKSFDTVMVSRSAIREAIAALSQPAPAGEPTAWAHDQPGRVDVIHDEVKQSRNRVGELKVEHYTIPLYTHPSNESTREAVIKECAKAAADEALVENLINVEDLVYNNAVKHCVNAIRALSTSEKTSPVEAPDYEYEYMCPNCVTPWKCNGPHIEESAHLQPTRRC